MLEFLDFSIPAFIYSPQSYPVCGTAGISEGQWSPLELWPEQWFPNTQEMFCVLKRKGSAGAEGTFSLLCWNENSM